MPARIEPAAPPYAPEVQRVLDRLPRSWMPPFRIFTTLARSVPLFQRFVRGAPNYFPETKITLRQREVLLDRVNARCRCEYEWGLRIHHFAAEAGLTDAQLHSLVHGNADDPCWDENDRLLIRLADELHATCDVSDGLWRDLSAAFSADAILELLMLAGYYRMGAYINNALRFPPEPMGRPFPAK